MKESKEQQEFNKNFLINLVLLINFCRFYTWIDCNETDFSFNYDDNGIIIEDID